MEVLLKLPGKEFQDATASYTAHFKRYVDRMEEALATGTPLANLQAFRDYVTYCRWPIRQLEYSFAVRYFPTEPGGPMLDVGSGVTPWPYFAADRGWPTVSIDLEVDQVTAMQRHGLELFGVSVDHRVGDIRGLGFADGTFAVVTCISVLEHLLHADVPLALAEIVRVCRPGGRIILTTDIYASDDQTIPVARGAFPATTLERIFRPLAQACGASDEFATLLDAHRRLSLQELETFWTQHWKPGLWQEQNRGYGAVGMVFDLPASLDDWRNLILELRQIAQHLDYPPPGEPYHQTQTTDGTMLWLVGDEVMTQGVTSEEFEYDIRSFFEHFLRPGDTVFDVGANVGLYTLLFSRLVGPAGQVHAFEPTGQIFGCLARNALTAAHNNIRLNRMGLSHENGSLTLLHGRDDNACFNSFGEPIAAGASSEGQYDSEVAWVLTLDDYVREYAVSRLDVLKVDVEGWEERVLRGGVGTLASQAPVLALEFCSPAARNANSSCVAISRLLSSLGYDLFRYQPTTRDLDLVEPDRDAWEYANLVAVKREALPDVIRQLKEQQPFSVNPDAISTTVLRSERNDTYQPNTYGIHDILLLLEENRSLRQRVTAGILDREVATLQQKLQISEADRVARLDVIQRLDAQVHEQQATIEQLRQNIEQLRQKLATAEADRAARLDVIQRLDAQVHEQQATIEQLRQKLATAEADRAARLDVIQRQEADRTTQQELIQKLQAELVAERLHPLVKMGRRLKGAR